MKHDISRRRNVGLLSHDPRSWMEAVARAAGGKMPASAAPSRSSRSLRAASAEVFAPMGFTWTPLVGPWAEESLGYAVVDASRDDVAFEQDPLRAVDGAVLVLDARSPVEEADVRAFGRVRGRDLPCIVAISSIDEAGASFDARVRELGHALGVVPLVVQRPILDGGGTDASVRGEATRRLIDVLDQRELLRGPRGQATLGGKRKGKASAPAEALRVPLVPSAEPLVSELRRRVVEVAIEGDEALMGAFSVGMEVGADEVGRAIRRKIAAKGAPYVVVVGVGSPEEAASILDAVAVYLPSPDERPAARGTDPRRGMSVARFARADDPLAALVVGFEEATGGVRGLEDVAEVTWLRLLSGTLSHEAKAWLYPRGTKAEIGRMFVLSDTGLEEVDEVLPGSLVAMTDLRGASLGDTLTDPRAPIVLTTPTEKSAEVRKIA